MIHKTIFTIHKMMCKTNFVLSTELILKDATCQREKQILKSQDVGFFPFRNTMNIIYSHSVDTQI